MAPIARRLYPLSPSRQAHAGHRSPPSAPPRCGQRPGPGPSALRPAPGRLDGVIRGGRRRPKVFTPPRFPRARAVIPTPAYEELTMKVSLVRWWTAAAALALVACGGGLNESEVETASKVDALDTAPTH